MDRSPDEALQLDGLSANCGNGAAHPLQLSFHVGPTLMKGFVNPLSQVHECFNGHP
jgi:hypothetical protein